MEISIGNIIKYREEYYCIINVDEGIITAYKCVVDNKDSKSGRLIPVFNYQGLGYCLKYRKSYSINVGDDYTIIKEGDEELSSLFKQINEYLIKADNRLKILNILLGFSIVLSGTGYDLISKSVNGLSISFFTLFSSLAGFVLGYNKESQAMKSMIIGNILNANDSSKISRIFTRLLLGKNIEHIIIPVISLDGEDNTLIECGQVNSNEGSSREIGESHQCKLAAVSEGFSGRGPRRRRHDLF